MSPKSPADAGFTLTEAMAALMVLALALSQLPTLVGHLGRMYQQTTETVQASRETRSLSREIRRGRIGATESVRGDSDKGKDQLDPEYHHPCQFDVVGRRCL